MGAFNAFVYVRFCCLSLGVFYDDVTGLSTWHKIANIANHFTG
jgi:hypothetical protein